MKVWTLDHQLFSQFCRGDEVCEEMLALVTLSEHTTGVEICKTILNELSTRQIEFQKYYPPQQMVLPA